MKHFNLISFLLFLPLLLTPPLWQPVGEGQAVAEQEDENVSFKWGFAALTGTGKDRKYIPINQDTVLKTGDEIKMVIELKKPCFVYLVYQNSIGDISMLFPYDANQFTADYKTAKNYYIPRGRTWFRLDSNTGRETFYLLASAQRLSDLESLLGKYKEASGSRKSDLTKEIISEIRNVRKRFRTFTTYAERPISIGGNVRGVTGQTETERFDVATIAQEISANNFYGKTYTIDHQ